jgi:putative Mg2+ transporter-C (MgtC) family protein
MTIMAMIGCLAIIATNTLLRPVSRFVNRRTGAPGVQLTPASGFQALGEEYVLEVTTTEKNEPRVRAMVLQTVDRPEYTLRSLDIQPSKSSQIKLTATVSARNTEQASGLESAVQRISMDPKVTSSRWWQAEAND